MVHDLLFTKPILILVNYQKALGNFIYDIIYQIFLLLEQVNAEEYILMLIFIDGSLFAFNYQFMNKYA